MSKIFYYITIITTLLSCGAATGSFRDIPGVYTCNYQNEFYTIYDTLILTNIKKEVYNIERHTGIDQNVRKEKWTLAFDEEKDMLTELQKGKFVLVMNGNLIFGNRAYKKIKL